MSTPLLSAIIPVYNSEQYIGRCLESLIGQFRAEELEIVCVNDGSTDASSQIIASYCESHGNIKLLEQDNKGVSAARNSGIACAEGDYILFVDSDDWLDEKFADRIRPVLSSGDYDCIMFSLFEHKADTVELVGPLPDADFEGDESKMVEWMLRIDSPYHGYAGGKVIRRRILCDEGALKNSFNEQECLLEDEMFWLGVAEDCRKALFLNEAFYHYRRIEGSAVSGFDDGKTMSILLRREQIYVFVLHVYPEYAPLAKGRLALNIGGLIRRCYVLDNKTYLEELRPLWKRYPGSTLLPLSCVLLRRKIESLLCDAAMALHVPPALLKPLRPLLSRGMPE